MSSLVEFSMSPLDKGASVSKYVARSLEIIDSSGLDYELHAMGTILEGDFAECMAVIQKCFDRMSEDCERVTCSIKIDHRSNSEGRLKAKIASVESKVGKKLRT